MQRESLRQALAELVEQETGSKPTELGDETVLTEGLGMDSIDLVGLIVQVENKYSIKVDTEELRQVTTVGHLLDLLLKKIEAGGAERANA